MQTNKITRKELIKEFGVEPNNYRTCDNCHTSYNTSTKYFYKTIIEYDAYRTKYIRKKVMLWHAKKEVEVIDKKVKRTEIWLRCPTCNVVKNVCSQEKTIKRYHPYGGAD